MGGCLPLRSRKTCNTSYCLKSGGGTLPYTVPLAGFFVYHSLFVIVTRCLSLELLTTETFITMKHFAHYPYVCDPQTIHTIKMIGYIDPHITTFYNIYPEIFVNLYLLLTTFNPTSRGDCRYFVCVIFKRYAFSCGKKEWPRENYRFDTCNFAT